MKNKGDVDRFMLWIIILLVIVIVMIAMIYGGAWSMLHNLFIKRFS